MVLTGAQQFALRANKALANGDTSFKPRGSANKAAFDKLKREFDEQTKQVNAHTTTEADRIIEATSNRVLASIEERTQKLEGKIDQIQEQNQTHQTSPGSSISFPVNHAAIRTELKRGGFTPAQLMELYRAANLQPPTRLNAKGRSAPETAKYLLAEGLCFRAGKMEHIIQCSQILDYSTLESWMRALRHRQPVEKWQPPAYTNSTSSQNRCAVTSLPPELEDGLEDVIFPETPANHCAVTFASSKTRRSEQCDATMPYKRHKN